MPGLLSLSAELAFLNTQPGFEALGILCADGARIKSIEAGRARRASNTKEVGEMELEANIVQPVASRDGDGWRMEGQNTLEMPTLGSPERRSEIHASRLPTLIADALLSLDQAGWSTRNLEHITSDALGKILIRRALERMAAAADDLAALHELTFSGDREPRSAS